MHDDERPSWQRRPDLRETAKAYAAFTCFRDLLPRERSLARAYTACRGAAAPKGPEKASVLRTPPGRWKLWRTLYQWDLRAADYDTFVEAETRAATLDAIREMNTRFAAIARAATGKIVERLNALQAEDISPGTLMLWLEKAQHVERLARGEPTVVMSGPMAASPAVVPPDLSQLTDDELALMQMLLEKADGRGRTTVPLRPGRPS